jgi:hypothetical protein
MDERDDYGYGWCERGKRFEALKSGRRTGRINMIAAYCEQRLMAPFTVEGACNRVVERNLARVMFSADPDPWTSCNFR